MFVSDVNIQPNRTGFPGIRLEVIVGALLTFGLVASVAVDSRFDPVTARTKPKGP